jgi:pimeloyl-[acyl-carrier protein] methyl ester esterase
MAVQNIVLIHGWASDESIWLKTKTFLEPRYRVYTLNLPIGKNIHSYRDAVIDLITQNRLDQVILVGWSMGAIVGIQVALQLPYIVQGIVLVSGTSRFLADSPSKMRVLGNENTRNNKDFEHNGVYLSDCYQGGILAALIVRMKKRLTKSCKQTITDFNKLMFSSQEQARGLTGEIIADLACGRTWEVTEAQAGLDYLVEVDVRSELKGITCPVLLLHGEQDEICPIEGAVFIKGQIPGSQLICFSGVGHIPFLTNFEDFHLALEEWLEVGGLKIG